MQKFVNRKKRLHFDQRGCSFKHEGREIVIPQSELQNSMLLKKLVQDVTRIPDFRKSLQRQQGKVGTRDDFDPGRGDIAAVKFKEHERQFLQNLLLELKGQTRP